ncbi:hypothetical protein [Microbacterium sp. MPKO10]|uniref:hypothetical protein n=1 Tax=Microbacterium sp. MPKO10 TaxID=2989818 RepID=UPI00223691BE|nr:hypothetical protein [Microbacterium sp. MPKO10]MCW4459882.1 hypothetical protein [Microbacterium sp. MPKO10]
MDMTDQATLALIATVCAYLLGFILWVIIMWAIIRGGVLSALRKHHREVREEERARAQRP